MGYIWYPRIDDVNKSQNFIYLKTLQNDIHQPRLYPKAENRLKLAFSSLKVSLTPQLNDLKELAERERQKEEALLAEFQFKGRLSSDEASSVLRGFNALYQNKKILARNLKKIEAVADGKTSQGRIDISASFTTYLDQAIKEYFAKTPIRKIDQKALLKITKDALIRAFKSADSNFKTEEQHSYEDLVQSVENMSSSDPFIKDVFQIYFGTAWTKLEKELKLTNQKSKSLSSKEVKESITKSYGAGGNFFELVQQLILENLGEKPKHTGGSLQKADLVLAYTEVKIPTEKIDKKGAAVRAHFINKYREMYDNLDQATGSIVEINAKNYNLTYDNFKESGFSAQSLTSISNFEEMLTAYQYDADRTEKLIFALTNIGPDTITEDVGTVTHNLALLIAYFLFDDIDMDDGLNINAVHLLNLDGIYVPLSCFLKAAYDTLKDIEQVSEDMVKVVYSPQSVNYVPSTPDDPLTKKKWIDTVATKQNQNSIKVSFFKSFPKYIKQNIEQLTF